MQKVYIEIYYFMTYFYRLLIGPIYDLNILICVGSLKFLI